jgi:hypothetical protein
VGEFTGGILPQIAKAKVVGKGDQMVVMKMRLSGVCKPHQGLGSTITQSSRCCLCSQGCQALASPRCNWAENVNQAQELEGMAVSVRRGSRKGLASLSFTGLEHSSRSGVLRKTPISGQPASCFTVGCGIGTSWHSKLQAKSK